MRKVEFGGPIRAQTLWRCLCAIHLSSYVRSQFQSRGGVMLVAPPGHMKTAFLNAVAKSYPRSAVAVSDLNTGQLIKMKDSMASGGLRTLVITDIQKLSQRNASVAENLLGNLAAVVDEGFAGATWDSNLLLPSTVVRCTVMAAVTPAYYTREIANFAKSGFARRFLWPQIRLADSAILQEAVVQQAQLRFSNDEGLPPRPIAGLIDEKVSESEARELFPIVEYQIGCDAIAYQLVFKMFAVLRWWYRVLRIEEDPMDTLFEFGRALGDKKELAPITGLYLPGSGDALVDGKVLGEVLDNTAPAKALELDANSNSVFKSRAYQIQRAKLQEAKAELKKRRN